MKGPSLHIEGRAAIDGEAVFGPLSLDARGGGVTCLLGPSGVGKSTLLRLIAGLAPYVSFDGRITCGDGEQAAPRASFIQQSDMLLPWADVLANVTIGKRLRGEKADTEKAQGLLAEVGLSGFEHRFPNTLSGGQRQRVALARTLMEERPIVLLDEPFSALDIKTRHGMQALALRILAGKTVLLVTHDPGEAARLADDVAIMGVAGVKMISAPASPTPRPTDGADTIAFAAQLTAAMMREAA
ncbi:MAG: ATP-binding cassette domain-containing protein [Alphaproteobacteria bacterium]|nr:ATP-binding cassette domain-containing protein [Alphaproteobacteria bacterium]